MPTKPFDPNECLYASHHGYLTIDIAKRRTRCRVCNLHIMKGERRVGLGFHLKRWVPLGAGGYNRVTHYMHAVCLHDALENLGKIYRRCICGMPAKTRTATVGGGGEAIERVVLWGVNGGVAVPLCEDCSTTKFFHCDVCQLFHLRHVMNTVKEQQKWNRPVKLICDNCAMQSSIDTPRMEKKRKMAELKIEAELAQIRRLIREDDVLNTK